MRYILTGIGIKLAAQLALVIILGLRTSALADAEFLGTRNLDLSKVNFELDARGITNEERSKLMELALRIFAEAGVHPLLEKKENPPGSVDRPPVLRLLLDIKDLGGQVPRHLDEFSGTCPGKKHYVRKLQLFEAASSIRNPDVKLWLPTWTGEAPLPIIADEIPFKRLESDVRHLVNSFLIDYQVTHKTPPK